MRLPDVCHERRLLAIVLCAAVTLVVSGCGGSTAPATRPTASTGSAFDAPPTDPLLARADRSYHRYVDGELDALVTSTGAFVRAVRSGRFATARLLYPRARIHYERIEPAAEIWGRLDLAIDGRANDFVPITRFSGFHRLEQVLWAPGSAGSTLSSLAGGTSADHVADDLVADVARLRRLAASTTYTTLEMTSGATELLNEVETTKITGEEERYSHLDLVDIDANVSGCLRIIALVTPYLRLRSRQLLTTITSRAALVTAALHRLHAAPGADDTGFPGYLDLTHAQRRTLSNDIEALAEAVSLTTAATSR